MPPAGPLPEGVGVHGEPGTLGVLGLEGDEPTASAYSMVPNGDRMLACSIDANRGWARRRSIA